MVSVILTALLLAPLTWAATKEEYRAASVKGLRELVAARAKGSVQHVLDGAKDKKIAVLGRGEIMLGSRSPSIGRSWVPDFQGSESTLEWGT